MAFCLKLVAHRERQEKAAATASCRAPAELWVFIGGSDLLDSSSQAIARYPQISALINQYLQPFRTGDFLSGATKALGAVAQGSGAARSLPVNVAALAVGLLGGLLTLGLVLVFTFFLLL